MKDKITAYIILVCLLTFSIPRSCFAELAGYFQKDDCPQISLAAAKAVNLLDISGKIVKKYYDGTKDFFLNMHIQSPDNDQSPVCNAKMDKLFVNVCVSAAASVKRDTFSGQNFLGFIKLFDERMRGSPSGGTEITKVYLLSIEALQKGSVPAYEFINNRLF
ncbi:MAG: hypothetical protein LBL00_03125 [Endomicrobium sp.]|jgi:hypothetical protein|nr:hypothetical protein [Endomicrobium sp.]